ncbi:MAG: hypothetical protein QNK35_02090 [Bacteroides sp.]|nr:hypothetical protein [Bacteroides sp.]
MKTAARLITILFHPLIMPTIGLLIILNSGTYLSLLDPAAKRAVLFVMALGTLLFPLMMIPVLYYRNLISSLQNASREERFLPYLIILILYVITFVYFLRLPLSKVIHAYVLSVSILLFLMMVVTLWFRICGHTAALGGIVGLIIALILLYETPLELFLAAAILIAGLVATSRLKLEVQRPVEVYTGFLLGFAVVLTTMLVY